MTELHWARLKAEGAYHLRRGAWYRVVELTRDQVVVTVNQKPVPVPRQVVELAPTPSRRWTVVARPRDAVRLPESWGAQYAVCPSCRHRAPLHGQPNEMRCPRCSGLFEVAWDERYLERE